MSVSGAADPDGSQQAHRVHSMPSMHDAAGCMPRAWPSAATAPPAGPAGGSGQRALALRGGAAASSEEQGMAGFPGEDGRALLSSDGGRPRIWGAPNTLTDGGAVSEEGSWGQLGASEEDGVPDLPEAELEGALGGVPLEKEPRSGTLPPALEAAAWELPWGLAAPLSRKANSCGTLQRGAAAGPTPFDHTCDPSNPAELKRTATAGGGTTPATLKLLLNIEPQVRGFCARQIAMVGACPS